MSDLIFKILIVGDMGVGKSSLFDRYLEDRFNRIYCPTVGIEFSVSHLVISGKKVHLQISDAPGEERYHDMLRHYYRNSHGVIIVYDTTSLDSFRNVSNWLKELGEFCSKGVNLMLVGTKSDELEKRQVTQEKAARYMELYGLSFYEASAKSGINVKNIFDSLARECYNRQVLQLLSLPLAKVDDGDGDGEESQDQ